MTGHSFGYLDEPIFHPKEEARAALQPGTAKAFNPTDRNFRLTLCAAVEAKLRVERKASSTNSGNDNGNDHSSSTHGGAHRSSPNKDMQEIQTQEHHKQTH